MERPTTWGECRELGLPEDGCPWASCVHHNYLVVSNAGTIKIDGGEHRDPDDMGPSGCSLGVAERGGLTLEEVGNILNLTRERSRQIEVRTLLKIRLTGSLRKMVGE